MRPTLIVLVALALGACDTPAETAAPTATLTSLETAAPSTADGAEAFVRARIAETVGADKPEYFAPVQFWNHQDVYVLRKPL